MWISISRFLWCFTRILFIIIVNILLMRPIRSYFNKSIINRNIFIFFFILVFIFISQVACSFNFLDWTFLLYWLLQLRLIYVDLRWDNVCFVLSCLCFFVCSRRNGGLIWIFIIIRWSAFDKSFKFFVDYVDLRILFCCCTVFCVTRFFNCDQVVWVLEKIAFFGSL